MRKQLAAAVFVALVAGCTGKTESAGAAAGGESLADRLDAGISPSDWSLEKTASGIDGDTYTASRTYEFSDRKTKFQANILCVAGTGVTEFTVDSFIGDPQTPHEGSAFLTSGTVPGLLSPVGRAKTHDGSVTDLGAYFDIGTDYNNRIKFDFNNPVSQGAISKASGYSQQAPIVEEGDVSYAKLLLAALPMTVEVKNGAGVFELGIDKSKEVVEALEACGAGGALLTDSYLSRAQEAEQSARGEVIKNIKSICGYRGRVRQTSEQWIETAKNLSVSLDCAESAPDELVAFNSKIDGYLQKAQQQGIACSRDALLRQAEEAGLDGSFLWETYLENYCQG